MRPSATLTAAIAIALAGCDAPAAPVVPGPEPAGTAIVERVLDGDTLALRDGNRVRLVQVDAPERRGNECGNAAATAALTRLTPPGTRLTLERDPALDDTDRYGRLLRYARTPSGQLVNVELARQGAVAPYFYRGERGTHAAALTTAARDARRRLAGAWGTCPRATLDPERAWTTD